MRTMEVRERDVAYGHDGEGEKDVSRGGIV